MVTEENMDLILRSIESPEMAMPFDFEVLANLLDIYPDFHLLRKAFLLVGTQLGAKGENFNHQSNKWNSVSPLLKQKIVSQIEIMRPDKIRLSVTERVDRFLKRFQTIKSPSELNI